MAKSAETITLKLHFVDLAGWLNWLAAHAETAPAVWLKISKQQAVAPSINYAQALDAALCFSWIDRQKAKFEDVYWLQRFSRRTAKNPWSQINRDKAEKLII